MAVTRPVQVLVARSSSIRTMLMDNTLWATVSVHSPILCLLCPVQEPPYVLDGALLIYYAVVFGIYAGNQAWQEGIFTYFNISLHGWVTVVMVVSMAPLAQHAIHAAQCTPVFELCGPLLLRPLSSNPAGLLMAAPYQELRHTIAPPPPSRLQPRSSHNRSGSRGRFKTQGRPPLRLRGPRPPSCQWWIKCQPHGPSRKRSPQGYVR